MNAISAMGAAAGLGLGLAEVESTQRVVTDVSNWTNLEEFSQTIAYGKLTDINIALEHTGICRPIAEFELKQGGGRLIYSKTLARKEDSG